MHGRIDDLTKMERRGFVLLGFGHLKHEGESRDRCGCGFKMSYFGLNILDLFNSVLALRKSRQYAQDLPYPL
jgi:hypothetical protein